ncbi:MAG: hypothetical protein QN120_05200 [Armatimonadota bacterium]|nr:hypothetical protein [Armatimonadota bacterium]
MELRSPVQLSLPFILDAIRRVAPGPIPYTPELLRSAAAQSGGRAGDLLRALWEVSQRHQAWLNPALLRYQPSRLGEFLPALLRGQLPPLGRGEQWYRTFSGIHPQTLEPVRLLSPAAVQKFPQTVAEVLERSPYLRPVAQAAREARPDFEEAILAGRPLDILRPGALLSAPETLLTWLQAARGKLRQSLSPLAAGAPITPKRLDELARRLAPIAQSRLGQAVPQAYLFEGLEPFVPDVRKRVELAGLLQRALRASAPVGPGGQLTIAMQRQMGTAPAFFGALWGLIPQPISRLARLLTRLTGEKPRGASAEEHVQRLLKMPFEGPPSRVTPRDVWEWIQRARPDLFERLLQARPSHLRAFQPPLGIVSAEELLKNPERRAALARAARAGAEWETLRLGVPRTPTPRIATLLQQVLQRHPQVTLQEALRIIGEQHGRPRYRSYATGALPIPKSYQEIWQTLQARRQRSPVVSLEGLRRRVPTFETPETVLGRKMEGTTERPPDRLGHELLAILRRSVNQAFPGRDELVPEVLRMLQGKAPGRYVRKLVPGNRAALDQLMAAYRRGVQKYIPDPRRATEEALAQLRDYMERRVRGLRVTRRGRPPGA